MKSKEKKRQKAYWMLLIALFEKVQNKNNPKISIASEWISKFWCIYTTEY